MLNKLQYIGFFLWSIVISAQVHIVADTDKKNVRQNETFTLFVITEVNGNELIQETPLRTPDLSKFNVLGQGSVRQTFGDPVTNTVINQLVYEFLLEPKQVGRHKIGSFLITVNGKIHMTDPFDIVVREAESVRGSAVENTSDRVQVSMELSKREVFVNQPTLAILTAYSNDFNNLRRIGKVSFQEQEEIEIRPVSFEKTKIEQKDNRSSRVIAVAMVVPAVSGRVAIAPATVNYVDQNRNTDHLKSNSPKLSVKKLPEVKPHDYKDAVGRYSVTMSLDSVGRSHEISKPIGVTVHLKGQGNLRKEQLPKLFNTKDYSVYKPEIKSHIKSSEKGHYGDVVAHYIVIPKRSGKLKISSESFSYFDPETEKFVTLGPQVINLDVFTSEEIFNQKSTIEKVNEYSNSVLETVSTPIMETKKLKIDDNKAFNWKIIAGNYILIAVFILMLLIVYSFFRKFSSNQKKSTVASLGSVSEKEKEIREAQPFDVQSHLYFIEKMKSTESKSDFYAAIDSLEKEAQEFIQEKYHQSIDAYFESKYGKQLSEDYRELKQKIKIEKYSPVISIETQEAIYKEVERIFSAIA